MAETYRDLGSDNAAYIKAYLAKNKKTGGKDTVSALAGLGLLDESKVNPKNRSEMIDSIYNRANTDQAFFDTFVNKSGGKVNLDEKWGSASGVTAEMRAKDPAMAQAIYDKIDPGAPGSKLPSNSSIPGASTGAIGAGTGTKTGATPTSPVDAYTKQYQDYIDSLTAKQSETSAAKKSYLDFIAQKDKTLSDVGNQRIPLGFVTGQKAYVNEQANAEANRLQGNIGLAQESEQFAEKTGQAKLDYAKKLQEESAPIKLGDSLYQKQSDGTYKMIAGSEAKKSLPASAQEYEYAKEQGFKGSYEDYQNADANRKAKATGGGGTGLSSTQQTLLNGIINKYQTSPLIQASDRTVVLKNIIDQVNKDPSNGTLQLSLAYSFIQALDTYQSAVREGELGLVNSIDSRVGQLKNSIEKIQNGQIVRPDVAKEIAATAKSLVDTISQGAKQKESAYASQANTFGLGTEWGTFIGGFNPTYNTQPPEAPQATDYAIKAGDTLYKLAQQLGTTVQALQSANPGINPNQLQIGQKIKLPGGGGSNTDSILSQYGL